LEPTSGRLAEFPFLGIVVYQYVLAIQLRVGYAVIGVEFGHVAREWSAATHDCLLTLCFWGTL
jgi:hypothetical protein